MATYKFVNTDQLDADLLTVADKIREKAELGDQLAFPTGFVDGIDQCSSLNFSVVGGTTQPSDPKENTIWVNTETDITSWIFSATEPDTLEEGMVWFLVGTFSTVELNALKKNSLQVYPLSAKQYISGAWADVTAMSYQGGKWAEWVSYIVKYGVTDYSFKVIDKSWSADKIGANATTVTQGDGYISIKGTTTGYGAAYVETDLTGRQALVIEGALPVEDTSLLAVWSSVGEYVTSNMVASVQVSATGATLDISGLSGKMLVGVTTAYIIERKIVNMYLV